MFAVGMDVTQMLVCSQGFLYVRRYMFCKLSIFAYFHVYSKFFCCWWSLYLRMYVSIHWCPSFMDEACTGQSDDRFMLYWPIRWQIHVVLANQMTDSCWEVYRCPVLHSSLHWEGWYIRTYILFVYVGKGKQSSQHVSVWDLCELGTGLSELWTLKPSACRCTCIHTYVHVQWWWCYCH